MSAGRVFVVPRFDIEEDVLDDVTQAVIDAQRVIGVQTAVGYLVVGNPGRAMYELVRSVRRQWKVACGGEYPIEPARSVPRGEVSR